MVLTLGFEVSNPSAVPRKMYVRPVILTSAFPSSPLMYLPVKPPISLMLMVLASSPLSLETRAVTPAAALPAVIVVSDLIGIHFTAFTAGRALSLIVTLAVPADISPGGGDPVGDEHAAAPTTARTAADALKNCFCMSPPPARSAIASAREM